MLCPLHLLVMLDSFFFTELGYSSTKFCLYIFCYSRIVEKTMCLLVGTRPTSNTSEVMKTTHMLCPIPQCYMVPLKCTKNRTIKWQTASAICGKIWPITKKKKKNCILYFGSLDTICCKIPEPGKLLLVSFPLVTKHHSLLGPPQQSLQPFSHRENSTRAPWLQRDSQNTEQPNLLRATRLT